MPETPLIRLYQRLKPLPLGGRVFSIAYQAAAPYFLTIPARIIDVKPGVAHARMSQTPWVRNHLGTVHAIALCNFAEYTMGVLAEATVPSTHRWLPKGMTVEYLARAAGTMHATATLDLPATIDGSLEAPVTITVQDKEDKLVFTAEIRIWVSPRPEAT